MTQTRKDPKIETNKQRNIDMNVYAELPSFCLAQESGKLKDNAGFFSSMWAKTELLINECYFKKQV